MISREDINRLLIASFVVFVGFTTFSQITSGRILFERKTNLKKIFKDNQRMKSMNMDLSTRIEEFELLFNDTSSAFLPIEGDEDLGWSKYLTSHNIIYKDLNKQEKVAVLDMWGTEMYIRDKMIKRDWKITSNKRKLGGYMCRKAFWEMNDSTRIYAWFSVDVVPSIGPEGFDGLPGAILGLATENGTIIYFAKEVEAMKPEQEKLVREIKGKDVYTTAELKEILIEKMGRWVKPKDIDSMFTWL